MDGFLGIGLGELFFIAIIALIVLGPERLPSTLREIAKYWGYIRNLSSELMAQFSDELNALDEINPRKIFNEMANPTQEVKESKPKATTPAATTPKPVTPAKTVATDKSTTTATPKKPATTTTKTPAKPTVADKGTDDKAAEPDSKPVDTNVQVFPAVENQILPPAKETPGPIQPANMNGEASHTLDVPTTVPPKEEQPVEPSIMASVTATPVAMNGKVDSTNDAG
jgi:sec-independent protein translocase protein TatB